MKKQIAIAAGIAVLSTGAFASKARLQALGEDAEGSQFLDDSRNVMLNPAMLNFHKDFVMMEWGQTTNAADAVATPRAEGGMFKAHGNMVYGLYLGSESNTSNALRAAAGVNAALLEQNSTDFFVAGDAGVQWGVRLTYQDYKDKQAGADMKANAMRTTIGVVSGNVEAFLNYGLGNNADDGTNEFKGKTSMDLGVTYNQGEVDYMVRYRAIEGDNAADNTYKLQQTHIGVAKMYKLNDKANAWASAWYKMDTSDDEFTAAGETKNTYLPVTIAMEVQAKDWLMFRGSVGQNVLVNETEDNAGKKKTMNDTTLVAAGASLVFGDLTIDGMIGNNNTGTTPGAADTSAGAGTLRTDSLMSRVGVTYKF